MINFTVPGEPVPQSRPRVAHTGHAYYDTRTTAYREKVKQCAEMAQMGREGLTGALALVIDCEFSVPESWPKNKRRAALNGQWHTSRKDLDNVVKNALDAISGICFEDDKQVALLLATKHYSNEAKTKISIFELSEVKNPLWLIATLKRDLKYGIC
jgi:Holliday junction resolvase RusA-like endonuclease